MVMTEYNENNVNHKPGLHYSQINDAINFLTKNCDLVKRINEQQTAIYTLLVICNLIW